MTKNPVRTGRAAGGEKSRTQDERGDSLHDFNGYGKGRSFD
jgi:hypothetical protein